MISQFKPRLVPTAPRAEKIDFRELGSAIERAILGARLDEASASRLSDDYVELQTTVAAAISAGDEERGDSFTRLGQLLERRGAQVWPGSSFERIGDDKPLQVNDSATVIDVAGGERTRIWVKPARSEDCWIHLLLCPDFAPSAEPVLAVRYLFENQTEEVALRFRRSALVLHREVEVPVQQGRPLFVSVGVVAGEIQIYLNALPVYHRAARHPAVTSFIVDAIGISAGPTKVSLPLIATQSGARFLGIAPTDVAALATGLVEQARATGQRSRLHEALHALAKTDLLYDHTTLRAIIEECRAMPMAFSAVMEDLLLARLSESDRIEVMASRPLPIVRIKDVSISLSSNPANKTLKNPFAKKEDKRVKIVDKLSFEAFSGDIIGIIGKNGAGKTTLLKSLVGAIPISNGRIEIEDRPILLRPGAGMQGELTGRQNIEKTGLYMDMSMREIAAIMEDVVSFAELEDHIDRPIKYYSDGMRARLVFSMATAMPREILLLDELLSAGDMGFQERAIARLHQFLSHAKLVFVVQHTFDFILTRCTNCLLLEKGVPVYFGDPRIATELYKESL